MNKEDLKNKIETFYIKSLNVDNPDFLITLDAVKSIIGINLITYNNYKIRTLSFYIQSIPITSKNEGVKT